ncbi:MAG: arsenate reductase (glutaredoxin) [Comamonas sp.]|nr:arsenate reductase (glutaredoxin) [Comamonas sp.]
MPHSANATPSVNPVTIYHNPQCSNSRGALQILRDQGIEPTVIEYTATPLTAPELAELFAHIGQPIRSLLRSKEAQYQALDLDNPALSDAELIAAVASHPILMNRPIVVTGKGAALCRPPETVLELL